MINMVITKKETAAVVLRCGNSETHMQWCSSVFPFFFLPFDSKFSLFQRSYTLLFLSLHTNRSITMVGCIPCVNIKHATLVKNCYPPVKDGSTIPRSSELSYLTFYASSRPAKLTKVGSFIQKKVEKDIRKGRKSYVSLGFTQSDSKNSFTFLFILVII